MPPPAFHPVLSCADAMAWEEGLLRDEAAEWNAMQRAGTAVAQAIEEDFREIGGLPENARILLLIGRGHNSGDALIATTTLLRPRPAAKVEIAFACPEGDSLRPLTQRAQRELVQAVGEQQKLFDWEQGMTNSYDLCLDGVFGMRFRLPMHEATAKLLAWVNTHPRIRLRAAVDLPSGLGVENAGTVFRADFTYATGIAKSPVVAEANAAWVGRLRCLDLDFFAAGEPARVDERILAAGILAPLAGLRSSQTDKRSFGHLFVVGGSHSYPGAVVLAVRAALRSGVGLVTAFVPASLAAEFAARHAEAIWVGCAETVEGGMSVEAMAMIQTRISRASALLIGPGLGSAADTLALACRLVEEATVPVVLDADALRAEVVESLRAKPFICTPHAGELERISARLYVAKRFAAPHGVLVSKGPRTTVTDGKTIYHSPFGGPVLARGGSGDILAGLIGGLLAQNPGEPLLAACRGTVWHGLAADLLARTKGQVAVEISEILEQLGPALNPSHARIPHRAAGVHDPERPAQCRPDHS